jgi:hypothetical protein
MSSGCCSMSISTGATHIFVCASFVQQHNLPQQHSEPFVVQTANNQQVTISTIIPAYQAISRVRNRRDLLSDDLQKVMLFFCKPVLGVRTGVPSSCLLDEVDAVPLQSYWLGACLKFWNSLLRSENLLLLSVALSDIRMAHMFSQCGSRFAKFALPFQSAKACLQLTQDHCINTQQAMFCTDCLPTA